ncbi:MAG TPA: glycine zipper family protein [Rhodocyclaceae bacterium]|nr:glycine zipper family protein [Rhodocyclaceae bacterium]
MASRNILVIATVAAATLAGCATAPLAPRVAVMPAPGKPFEQFVAEERLCRNYAEQSVGGQAEAIDNAAIGSAAVGTAIGAVAGAAIGGRQGAAVGAGSGLIVGSASGSGRAGYMERDAQRRYDIAYQQCMYAKGNQIPGQYVQQPSAARPAAYPPPPPPPPGSPPPPPAPRQ